MEKQLAFSKIIIKAVSEDKRTITGIATTPTPDRVGDIVEPMGAKFASEIPLLWMHDHRQPVGTARFGKATAEGIPFTATIAEVPEPAGLKARLDEAWQSVKTGLVAAVSIGFRALEYSFMDEGGIRFTHTEIYELSLVTVPAQADATIETIKSLWHEGSAGNGKTLPTDAKAVKTAGASAKKATVVVNIKNVQTKETNMNYAEQIKNFRATALQKTNEMSALMEKSEGETLSAEAQDTFDTLAGEVEACNDQVKRLEKLQAMQASTAKPVTEKDGQTSQAAAAVRSGIVTKAAEKLEAGMEFTRYVMCLAKAKGDVQKALILAKANYANSSPRVVNVLEYEANNAVKMVELWQSKAAVAAGTTLNATWAAPLVDFENFTGDFIEFLRPRTIVGRFGTDGIPSLRRIPFNVRILAQTSASSASWVGEGSPKPLTKMDFNDVELRWAKIAAISVITEELMRFSDPSAERLVRDELARAVIERMDIDFVDPTKAAVTNVSPASITNGVTPITPEGGTDAEAVRCDLMALWAPFLEANNVPEDAVYIMDSRTAQALSSMRNPLGQREFPEMTVRGGSLDGTPVIVSNYVARNTAGGTVILVNASDIYLSDDGQVDIAISREASLQMDNAPTNNSATPTATTMVSMFQTNSVAIRAERYVNWAKRRAGAVQWMTGVAWGVC